MIDISVYAPMVSGIAGSVLREFRAGYLVERDDLEQEGHLALLRCSGRFVAGRASFSTYAYSRVRGAMIDAIRRARRYEARLVVYRASEPRADVEPTAPYRIELHELVAACSPSELALLVCVELGPSASEIAHNSGVHRSTISRRRAAIRAHLQRSCR